MLCLETPERRRQTPGVFLLSPSNCHSLITLALRQSAHLLCAHCRSAWHYALSFRGALFLRLLNHFQLSLYFCFAIPRALRAPCIDLLRWHSFGGFGGGAHSATDEEISTVLATATASTCKSMSFPQRLDVCQLKIYVAGTARKGARIRRGQSEGAGGRHATLLPAGNGSGTWMQRKAQSRNRCGIETGNTGRGRRTTMETGGGCAAWIAAGEECVRRNCGEKTG